jgi:hypothetical protein
VHLELQGDRAALTVQGQAVVRILKVRAASRQDTSVYAVAEVQVQTGAEADESKAAPGAPPSDGPAAVPCWAGAGRGPAVWDTPFTRPDPKRAFNAIAWDPTTSPPTLVALEVMDTEVRVVRLGLDGSETVVSQPPPAPGEAGPPWPDPPHLDAFGDGLAVLPDGDLVVADEAHQRICRVSREGALSVLAGTGAGAWNGDTGPDGRPRPALRANLGAPRAIAVTPDGEVVFTDPEHNRIRRFRPGGCIETLAGNGLPHSPVDNDPDRRHPATAASLDLPHSLAVAPDGRIVFSLAMDGLVVLHPDGTLERLDDPGGMGGLVAVTAGQEIIYGSAFRQLWGITRQGTAGRILTLCLSLQSLVALPGCGLLALDRHRSGIWLIDPPGAGWCLAEQVEAVHAALEDRDLPRAARIRANLARWAETVPPSVDTVRRLLRWNRAGACLPGLVDDLQDLPWEFLRGDHAGSAIRARIALRVLDLDLEAGCPGLPASLAAMAAAL